MRLCCHQLPWADSAWGVSGGLFHMAILYFAEDTQDIYARCGGVAFEDMLINVFKGISARPGVRPPHCASKKLSVFKNTSVRPAYVRLIVH